MSKPDDKKISVDHESETKEIKIPPRRNSAKKFFLPEKINVWLGELLESISRRYVVNVACAAFLCVVAVGLALMFLKPSVVHVQKPVVQTEVKTDDDLEDAEKHVQVKIREGLSTAEIADRLSEKGVIGSTFKFRVLARLHGYDDKFRPGSYSFTLGMSDDEVFAKLLTGEKKLIRFTIPEGFGVKEIADRLVNLDIAEKEEFLNAAKDFAPYEYMKKRENVLFSAEGFLFPDTYAVESDVEIEEILSLMANTFDHKLTVGMRKQAEKMGLSVYDLITLASLVEREVRFPEDRPIVAQVLLKRLKLNMPLQTDATLQYLMDTPKEDVSIEDTKIDSPYNTYQHLGLPPGPIANPGIASIEAVLHPAETDYLYFVADRRGHNHYANTYEEHLKLVNQYR